MQLFKLSILSSCKIFRCDFLVTKSRLPHDFIRIDSQTVPQATQWRRAGVESFYPTMHTSARVVRSCGIANL
jgi:hypothetical protein